MRTFLKGSAVPKKGETTTSVNSFVSTTRQPPQGVVGGEDIFEGSATPKRGETTTSVNSFVSTSVRSSEK